MTGVAVDVLLGLVLLSYAITGFRQGFVVSVLSLLGFLAGGALGMWLLPLLLERWVEVNGNVFWRSAALVFGVFVLATLGQGAAVMIGSRVRGAVTVRSARVLDSVLGAVASVVAVAVLMWFLAGALRGAAPVPLARALGASQVLQAVDRVVPAETGRLFAGFRSLLDQEGFPRVFGGLESEPISPVAPPRGSVAASAAVARAAGSVVKITGLAVSCGRGQEGSGWVLARERVVTNAHVVAGMRSASVRVGGRGPAYAARIVVFDPRRDLAVLAVPGLPAPALALDAGTLRRGQEAAEAGFPLDGPYRVDPARVRAMVTARGADIFGNPGVTREVYSMFTRVEPGNSGGPLLTAEGKVAGVVFAKSLDDAQTGYALTLAEAAPVLSQGRTASQPVTTRRCSAA